MRLTAIPLLSFLLVTGQAPSLGAQCATPAFRGRIVLGSVCQPAADPSTPCLPLAGATVLITDRTGRIREQLETSDNGSFRYEHTEQDEVTIEVLLGDFTPARARLSRFRGRGAGLLSLQVVLDRNSQLPCGGSSVKPLGAAASRR